MAYRGGAADIPNVRRISTDDLKDALRRGFDDFLAMPSHVAFVCLIYPILGVYLASMAFGYDVVPLLYPLISGFALVGPLAAIGLYELSRRRELGLDTKWSHALDVLRSPAIGSIVVMGAVLVAVFLLWMLTAQVIFKVTVGSLATDSVPSLFRDVLGTGRGWTLILLGNVVGAAFAVLVLTISVIAFPIILDRNVGVGTAIQASRAAVLANPVPMAIWGLVVAGLLALGSLPLFVGLAIVLPILGHATWHLYRKVVTD
jgi:uncharacterized membrane protein